MREEFHVRPKQRQPKQEESGGLWARLRRPSKKSLGGLLAVGFRVGRAVLGRFQHRDGSHEHREILYFLPRDV
jgi:hypothetical protein